MQCVVSLAFPRYTPTYNLFLLCTRLLTCGKMTVTVTIPLVSAAPSYNDRSKMLSTHRSFSTIWVEEETVDTWYVALKAMTGNDPAILVNYSHPSSISDKKLGALYLGVSTRTNWTKQKKTTNPPKKTT